MQRRSRPISIVAASVILSIAVTLSACGGGGAGDTGDAGDDADIVVLPTDAPTPAAADDGSPGSSSATSSGTSNDDAAVSARADVLRAGEAAAAATGGEVIRTSVDLLGYVVQLRRTDGTFETVQLDVGFGVVFVEADEDGRRDADQLADDVDLRLAVDLALETALGETIGAAGDGVVVNAEIERDGYDIDIQYPDGRVLEVRLTDDHVVSGTRIRG